MSSHRVPADVGEGSPAWGCVTGMKGHAAATRLLEGEAALQEGRLDLTCLQGSSTQAWPVSSGC